MTHVDLAPATATALKRPRIGFVGTGWIGLNRMEALIASGAIDAAAVAEPSPDMMEKAKSLAPDAKEAASFDDLLLAELDGIVIATPSGLHAEQSIRALRRGLAVFCQKPLGRTAKEVDAVLQAARAADCLLGVDFSYRFTRGMQRIRELVWAGDLGEVYAGDLVFHNAYGPDKAWFYDPAQSGGGCLMDLGVHLVDLALWVLDFPEVVKVDGTLFHGGERLSPATQQVEDYALATLHLSTGAVVQLACSWRLPAGCDAVISASFYGTAGGAALRNVNGSFYDFVAEHYRGTAREILAVPPDAWGGRAAIDWARRLAANGTYSAEADRLLDVARVLDRIYGR